MIDEAASEERAQLNSREQAALQGRALAPFVREFHLPRQPFEDLIDGVRVVRIPIDVSAATSRVRATGRLIRTMLRLRREIEPVEMEGFQAFRPRPKSRKPEEPKQTQPVYGRRVKKYSNRRLYDTDSSDLGLSVIAHKPSENSAGHFILTLTPKQEARRRIDTQEPPERLAARADVVVIRPPVGLAASRRARATRWCIRRC